MTEEEIAELKKKLKEHETRILKLESLFEEKPVIAKKKLSIKEFILQKQPEDDIQKALVIGYYLEKYEDFSCFNFRDIEQGFRDAKETVPENTADKIQKNIAKGHMMKTGKEKDDLTAFVLTNDGERFVENSFKKKKV